MVLELSGPNKEATKESRITNPFIISIRQLDEQQDIANGLVY